MPDEIAASCGGGPGEVQPGARLVRETLPNDAKRRKYLNRESPARRHDQSLTRRFLER